MSSADGPFQRSNGALQKLRIFRREIIEILQRVTDAPQRPVVAVGLLSSTTSVPSRTRQVPLIARVEPRRSTAPLGLLARCLFRFVHGHVESVAALVWLLRGSHRRETREEEPS